MATATMVNVIESISMTRIVFEFESCSPLLFLADILYAAFCSMYGLSSGFLR